MARDRPRPSRGTRGGRVPAGGSTAMGLTGINLTGMGLMAMLRALAVPAACLALAGPASARGARDGAHPETWPEPRYASLPIETSPVLLQGAGHPDARHAEPGAARDTSTSDASTRDTSAGVGPSWRSAGSRSGTRRR